MSGDLPDPADDPRALRVSKKPIPLAVAFAATDGVCESLEGAVRYQAGDAILTGTRGERWTMQRAPFLASYQAVPPTRPGDDGHYVKAPSVSHALRVDRPLAVPVGWQADPLQARPGDWLLRYADGAYGVVQDSIFRETYAPAAGETRWPPP